MELGCVSSGGARDRDGVVMGRVRSASGGGTNDGGGCGGDAMGRNIGGRASDGAESVMGRGW